MAAYIELKPSYVGLTDSVTGNIRNIKLHDGHLWLETTTGTYIQLLDNYTQDTEANKPAAGTQGRWFYTTDTNKLYYDNGTDWNLITINYSDILVSSACDYVEWTNLDINTDKLYRIIGTIKNVSTSAISLACYYESDYTDTDYYTERMYASGSNVGTINSNNGTISIISANNDGMFKAQIKLTPSGYSMCTSQSGAGNGSNDRIDICTQVLTITQTNITQIRLSSNKAGGIGVNSWFRLIKGI